MRQRRYVDAAGSPSLACMECDFKCASMDELLEHFGAKHEHCANLWSTACAWFMCNRPKK